MISSEKILKTYHWEGLLENKIGESVHMARTFCRQCGELIGEELIGERFGCQGWRVNHHCDEVKHDPK